MIYLSQMLGIPVIDSNGEKIGTVNDLGIATGEVFPRVTSLAFVGPGKTPFMISWRKYVDSFDDAVRLKVPATDIRFSYLQPNEVLISRDLLNKQIVDTRGLRVVRVNDLKLSDSGTNQLRLLGAEVGARGILRALSPKVERAVVKAAKAVGKEVPEKIIAWSYMDLLDRELSDVQLSVSHKTLDDMHPADIADIIEQLDPRLRAQVFAQLDDTRAAETMAELDDDEMAAEIMGDMDTADATRLLTEMDPDDAAELVSELDYEKAETLLRLMGVKEEKAVRQLLGYREDTAGRIMTSEFLWIKPTATVADAVQAVRDLDDEEVETVNYLYVADEGKKLLGVVTLRDIVVQPMTARIQDFMATDVITCDPEDDQEDVAEAISKYNLLAIPVVDEHNRILGIVTVDDALDVMEEEHEEDLVLAGGRDSDSDQPSNDLRWLLLDQLWLFFWALGAAILVSVGNALGLGATGLALCVGLPVALLTADSMVDYVIGFFIEFDADDEDAPSTASFFWRGLGISVVFLALVLLVAAGLGSALFHGEPARTLFVFGFVAAVVAGLGLFLIAPLYLRVLRRRDEKGEETSRLTLRILAQLIAIAVYAVVAFLTCGLGA